MADSNGVGSTGPVARGVRTEMLDRVAVITVSDPERRNAMAIDLSEQLVEQVRRAEVDRRRDLAITTKRTLRAMANLDAQTGALAMEIRAQVASLESSAFAERLASLKARISTKIDSRRSA